MKAKFFQNFKL